jgi:hypothetical protein
VRARCLASTASWGARTFSGSRRRLEFPGSSGQVAFAAEGDADVHEAECGPSSFDVRVHQDQSRQLQRPGHVSRARRGPERVLRVAPAAAVESGAGGCPAASPGPCCVAACLSQAPLASRNRSREPKKEVCSCNGHSSRLGPTLVFKARPLRTGSRCSSNTTGTQGRKTPHCRFSSATRSS